MKWEGTIVRDPEVLVGKPRNAGTRISVELALRSLAAGDSIQSIRENFPHLKESDIRAALAYAADLVVREYETTVAQAHA